MTVTDIAETDKLPLQSFQIFRYGIKQSHTHRFLLFLYRTSEHSILALRQVRAFTVLASRPKGIWRNHDNE